MNNEAKAVGHELLHIVDDCSAHSIDHNPYDIFKVLQISLLFYNQLKQE